MGTCDEQNIPEERRVVAIDSARDACSEQFGKGVLLDIPAEMEQFVRDGAELDADARARFVWCASKLVQQMRMFH